MGIEITGFAYDSAGDALASKAVKLYDRNTTSNARASKTTDSNGKFFFDLNVLIISQMQLIACFFFHCRSLWNY